MSSWFYRYAKYIANGSEKEVELEVVNRMNKLGPNGFIIAPSHVVQPDVPVQNIVALYDTVKKYRG